LGARRKGRTTPQPPKPASNHPPLVNLKMSLATLARSSLKQFTTILAEVRKEHGDELSAEELETLMWDKIIAGAPEGKTSKIPSTLLKKMKIQLPYMPEIINYIGCAALKPCGGLYVPCGGKCVEGIQYCGTCMKSGAKFGALLDRGAPGSYTDPNDKREISYGTWLAKNEISIEDVHEMLHEQGFTFRIPEEYLTVNAKRAAPPKRRPGRPGAVKKTVVNDDGSESPQGSSLDGFDHKVILKKGNESDVSALSDEEENPIAAVVAARKAAEYAETVGDKYEQAVFGKAKKPSKEEKEVADQEKALAKAAKEAAKKLKDEEKDAAKKLKEEEKKEKEEKPKKEKAPKEEKPKKEKAEKEEKPKKEKAEKKEKEEKPKKKESPKSKKPESPGLKHEDSEDEDEEIVIDGEEYILRGNSVFDEEGTLVGTKVDGKIEWDETVHANKKHMNR